MSNEMNDYISEMKDIGELISEYDAMKDPELYELFKDQNRKLVYNFPWLKPVNVWTGKEADDYDFTWTHLDEMPVGWKKAFGLQMCQELQAELERFDFVDEYQIVQVKEKFGSLRWYTNGSPIGTYEDEYETYIGYHYGDKTAYDKWPDDQYYWKHCGLNCEGEVIYHLHKWIDKCHISEIEQKYEELSEGICCVCGKDAEYITTGWICPYCEDCIKDVNDNYKTIYEFHNIDENEDDNE